MTDFATWLLDHKDKIFTILIYRRVFTPYEQKKCYMDESRYEDDGRYSYCTIEEAIEIPGDILLGVKAVYDPDDLLEQEELTYYKLSEVRLSLPNQEELE